MYIEKEKIQEIVETTRQYILAKEPFPDPDLRTEIKKERIEKFAEEIQNGVGNAVLYFSSFRTLVYQKEGAFFLTLFAGPAENGLDPEWTKRMEQQFKGLKFRSIQGAKNVLGI